MATDLDIDGEGGGDAATLRPAVDRLLESTGLAPVHQWQPLAGGGNNRVIRIRSAGGRWLLKIYFRHPGDPRDRLGTEFGFVTFAWRHGLTAVPRPVAADADRGLALYEWVAGRRLQPGQVDGGHVRQAMEFWRGLNRLRSRPGAGRMPAASEACFSTAHHLDTVGRRLARLGDLTVRDETDREAAAFVRQRLEPAWRRVRARWPAADPGAGSGRGEPLAREDRCLSPSDFGFHNALRETGGRLRFIDFEYAGWDDPAKTVCDFFCQPAVPVPLESFSAVLQAAASQVRRPAALERRVAMLMPVYRIKWCTIMLNDFMPVGGRRRVFAARGGGAGRRRRQLDKARDYYRQAALDA